MTVHADPGPDAKSKSDDWSLYLGDDLVLQFSDAVWTHVAGHTTWDFRPGSFSDTGAGLFGVGGTVNARIAEIDPNRVVLNVSDIAGDNIVNIAEKAAGFAIAGNTGSKAGVSVTVSVGGTDLTATSADADPATWSVAVPADAAYIAGTAVAVSVSAAKTGLTSPDPVERTLAVDLVAPAAPVSASVPAAGTSLTVVFGEDIEAATGKTPEKERFTVSAADGAKIAVGSVAVSGANVTLGLSPTIKTGQTVTVAYTDPTTGDDAAAVQDAAGNDAASFTGVAVANGSGVAATAPAAPTGLEAGGADEDRIALEWKPPADTGGRAIAGYRIEISEDVTPLDFTVLVANHTAKVGGKIVTSYTQTAGLSLGDVRHYRVKAINSVGPGRPSNVAAATAVHPDAPGAPTALTATAKAAARGDATTRIDLAWDAPADTGASAIAHYRIEVSEDVTPLVFTVLAADHATMEGGAIVTAYPHSGLGSEATRHYRVFAVNGEGTGLASPAAHATSDDIAGPEPESATVPAAGTSLTVVFGEDLDGATGKTPAKERFTVSAADGAKIVVSSLTVSGAGVTLALSPTIKTGQTITVAYTDPTTGDDAEAVQDAAGNDAAAFANLAVTNDSTVAATAPAAPAGLEAGGAGETSIVVTWDAPADTGGRAITGYVIEVSTDGTDFTELVANHDTKAAGGGIETKYTHTGLTLGDVRHYRAKARNAAGNSGLGPVSNVAAATAVHPDAPGAPTGLTATAKAAAHDATTTVIDLAWTKPGNIGESAIAHYRIEVSTDGSTFTELVAEHATMKNGAIETAYAHTGLGSEVTRHYRVFAVNDEGTSLPSDADDATTVDIVAPAPVSASVPAAGASLTVVFGEDLDAATGKTPAKERFTVSAEDGAKIVVGSLTVSGANVTLALSPTIKLGQTVTVGYADPTTGDDAEAVQDDAGNDAVTFASLAVTNGSTVAATAPAAPTGLKAGGAGSDRIALEWKPPADTGGRAVAGYRIEISTDGGTDFTVLVADHNAKVDGKIVTSYTQTADLSLGDVRHYRVKAINSVGAGGPSNVAGATAVHPGAPDAPTGLTATAKDAARGDTTTVIDLAWTKPEGIGASAIAHYRIEVSTDGGTDFTELVATHATVEDGAIVTAYVHTGLGSEATRHYRVFAVNDEGSGLASAAAHATSADIAGPDPESASVPAAGTSLTVAFDEDLDGTTGKTPEKERFTVSAADGAKIVVGSLTVSGADVTLALSPTARPCPRRRPARRPGLRPTVRAKPASW